MPEPCSLGVGEAGPWWDRPKYCCFPFFPMRKLSRTYCFSVDLSWSFSKIMTCFSKFSGLFLQYRNFQTLIFLMSTDNSAVSTGSVVQRRLWCWRSKMKCFSPLCSSQCSCRARRDTTSQHPEQLCLHSLLPWQLYILSSPWGLFCANLVKTISKWWSKFRSYLHFKINDPVPQMHILSA